LSWLFRPSINKANTARLPRCSTNTERRQAANRPSQTHRRPAALLHRQVIRRRPLAGPASKSSYARSSVPWTRWELSSSQTCCLVYRDGQCPGQGGNSVLLGLVVWSIETNQVAPLLFLYFPSWSTATSSTEKAKVNKVSVNPMHVTCKPVLVVYVIDSKSKITSWLHRTPRTLENNLLREIIACCLGGQTYKKPPTQRRNLPQSAARHRHWLRTLQPGTYCNPYDSNIQDNYFQINWFMLVN
jgi:hypothetical protein